MAILSNQGTITFNNGTASGTALSNVTEVNVLDQFSLNLNKVSLTSTFVPGENITYQLIIKNIGTSDLYNITLSDNLSGAGHLTYLSNSAVLISSNGRETIVPTATTPLTFTLPAPLLSGATVYLTYVATVSTNIASTVTAITNTVTATANGGSTTGTQISATTAATITANPNARVTITKSTSDSEVSVGETFSYTFTLTNSGNTAATGVVLTDVLPVNFIVSSITSSTGGVSQAWTNSDYTIEPSNNKLTLPNSSTIKNINVPAADDSGDGVTTITITGSITSV